MHKKVDLKKRTTSLLLSLLACVGFILLPSTPALSTESNNIDSMRRCALKVPSDSMAMESMFNLGAVFFEQGIYDSSGHYILLAIESAKNLGYANRESKLTIELGQLYFFSNDKEKCFETLDKAIALTQAANDTENEVYALLTKGNYLERVDQHSDAILTNLKGIAVARAREDKKYLDALLNNMSLVYQKLGDEETSIEYLLESVTLREAQKSKYLGISYANLGNVYKRQENFEEAIKRYEQSLDLLEDPSFIGARIVCLRNMGDAYTKMGEYDRAIELLKESYSMAKQKVDNERDFGMYHFLSASLYQDQGKFDSVITRTNQALSYFKSERDAAIRSTCYLYRTGAYQGLSEAQPEKKKELLNQAIADGERALELAQQIKSFKHINEVAKALMKAFSAAENTAKTLEYAELYGSSLDSLNKIEQSKSVIALQTKYEVEKKELQIEQLNSENENKNLRLTQAKELQESQRLAILLLVLGLSAFAGLILWIYRINRQKTQANKELETKNHLIFKQNEEKELLLKEIHHRVKNNLQIVSSLLDLQSMDIEDEKTLSAVSEGQSRVKAMALIHHKLYEKDDLSGISLNEYTEQLMQQVASIYPTSKGVKTEVTGETLYLDIDTAVPMGLILNELVSNAFKYAFSEGPGLLQVEIGKVDAHEYLMVVKDNGPGLPENFNFAKAKSLGLRLVSRLGKQLYGRVDYEYSEGAIFRIHFKDTLQRKSIE